MKNELGAFLRRRRQTLEGWLENQGIKTFDDVTAWAEENKADFTVAHSTFESLAGILTEKASEPEEPSQGEVYPTRHFGAVQPEEPTEEVSDQDDSALRAAKASLKKTLKEFDGTFSVGLGKGSLQVRVGTPGTSTENIPQEVDGFPVVVVDVGTLTKRV